MNTQQAILLRIHEEFSKLGIEFAFPTQTVFIGGLQEPEKGKNKELIFREPTEKTPANR
jgi:small-conductance mechanosensitive channel